MHAYMRVGTRGYVAVTVETYEYIKAFYNNSKYGINTACGAGQEGERMECRIVKTTRGMEDHGV